MILKKFGKLYFVTSMEVPISYRSSPVNIYVQTKPM